MFSQPTSSPMMTMMFGFFSCATALATGTAASPKATAAAAQDMCKRLSQFIKNLLFPWICKEILVAAGHRNDQTLQRLSIDGLDSGSKTGAAH